MIEYARIITKSSEGLPTIPPSASHDNGDWSPNDIYENELYMDTLTGFLYTRQADTIIRLSVGDSGNIVEHDASLNGEGNTGSPLGVNISPVADNQLQLTADGLFVERSKWIGIEVLNGTGATLPKMSVCYFKTSSSSADTPEVLLANASSESTSSKTMGLLKDDIAPGERGILIIKGEYDLYDTAAYSTGDRLWLDTVDGQMTLTPPSAPNHAVFLGIVSRSQGVNGRICISVQNGYELEELHNVTSDDYTTPQDEDSVLTFDSTQELWKRLTLFNLYTYLKYYFDSLYQAALGFTPENSANKGVAGGYASLDGGGKVPSTQLPSYVDDVIEVANYASLPVIGETGKIYATLDTNFVYRWSGSVYVRISQPNAVWGSLTGTLSDQTDLASALGAKEDSANKSVDVNTDQASNVKFPSVKAVYDWAVGLFTPKTRTITINGSTQDLSADRSWSISSSGLKGVHAVILPKTGTAILPIVNGFNTSTVVTVNGRLISYPFIPATSFTSTGVSINILVSAVGGLGRISMYDDLNGKPNNVIFTTPDLDCSTAGIKTFTISNNFVAGTTYWLCTHFNNATNQATGVVSSSMLPVASSSVAATLGYGYFQSVAFTTIPNPFTGTNGNTANSPLIFIQV